MNEERAMPSYDLPLFPLNTVLFPGQVLPLHIFEPRYREMIADCLASDRTFGVVFIREGSEVGDTSIPHQVGTTAVIQEVEHLPDGRMNILTLGQERFRLERYHDRKAYLVGRVTLWPWDTTLLPEASLRRGVQRHLARYMDLLSQISDSELELDQPPQDLATLAVLAAVVLRLPADQKQALLEIPSLDGLLRHLHRLLRQENRALHIMSAASPTRGEMIHPFSDN
jgi:Lon protease-like protein